MMKHITRVLISLLLLWFGAAHAQPRPTAGWGGGSVAGATAQATPADPTGTSSLSLVMAGFGVPFTPTSSGKVLIVGSGVAINDTVNAGTRVQISYGTGTAPINGAAVTGTQAGSLTYPQQQGATAGYRFIFAVNATVTGLTVGTPYWLDFAFMAETGGATNIFLNSISAIEIP